MYNREGLLRVYRGYIEGLWRINRDLLKISRIYRKYREFIENIEGLQTESPTSENWLMNCGVAARRSKLSDKSIGMAG